MKKATIAMVAGLMLGGVAVAEQVNEPNPDYALVMKHLDTGGSILFYTDTDTFFEAIGPKVGEIAETIAKSTAEGSPEIEENAALLVDFLRNKYGELGLGTIAGYGYSGRQEKTEGLFLNRSFVHLRGEQKGLVKLVVRPPRERAMLNFAPTDTMYFRSFDVAPKEWTDFVRWFAGKVDPQVGEIQINQGLNGLDMAAQMPLTRILEAVNGEVSFSLAPVVGSPMTFTPPEGAPFQIPRPDVYISVETPDKGIVESIELHAASSGLAKETVELGGLTFTSFKLAEPYSDLRLTTTHDGSHFFFSTASPDLLAAAVERYRARKGGLAEKPEFRELSAGIPLAGNYLAFSSKELLPTMMDAALAEIGQEEAREVAEKFIGIYGQMNGFHQQFSVTRTTEDGIESITREARDPRLMLGTMAALPAGIMAAIAVPSFLRAREISRRNACQENQSKIDGAKQQWALETNAPQDAVPTWDDLVGDQMYIRRMPVCPSGGSYTINAVDADPCCSLSTGNNNPQFDHTFPQ